MIVVVNRVKKGVEVPELEYTIVGDIVTIGAIDKVKYANWLALTPKIIIIDESSSLSITLFNGDELEIDTIGEPVRYYGVTTNFIEV